MILSFKMVCFSHSNNKPNTNTRPRHNIVREICIVGIAIEKNVLFPPPPLESLYKYADQNLQRHKWAKSKHCLLDIIFLWLTLFKQHCHSNGLHLRRSDNIIQFCLF